MKYLDCINDFTSDNSMGSMGSITSKIQQIRRTSTKNVEYYSDEKSTFKDFLDYSNE